MHDALKGSIGAFQSPYIAFAFFYAVFVLKSFKVGFLYLFLNLGFIGRSRGFSGIANSPFQGSGTPTLYSVMSVIFCYQ